jgi:hypothetical protein
MPRGGNGSHASLSVEVAGNYRTETTKWLPVNAKRLCGPNEFVVIKSDLAAEKLPVGGGTLIYALHPSGYRSKPAARHCRRLHPIAQFT